MDEWRCPGMPGSHEDDRALMRIPFFLICCAVSMTAGCSVARYASKDNAPNLTVTVETDLNIPLSRLDVMLDVHFVNPDCNSDFQGRLYLDEKKEVVGIPTGKIMELQALFITTGNFLLGGSSSDLRYGTLFTAKPGVKYLMEIIYRNKIFSAELFEFTAAGKKGRQIDRVPPSSCAEIMRTKR